MRACALCELPDMQDQTLGTHAGRGKKTGEIAPASCLYACKPVGHLAHCQGAKLE